MAVVIVLALLLSACGGGSAGLIQPQQINAPNDIERELIWRVWDAMHQPDYPVWIYRDTWTPGGDGRTWGDVGRGSNAPCPVNTAANYAPGLLQAGAVSACCK